MTVDPGVYQLAEVFVFDILRTLNRPLTPSQRAPLVDRVAQAAQRAIEDECQDIERELQRPSAEEIERMDRAGHT